jgi:hypothetical protein
MTGSATYCTQLTQWLLVQQLLVMKKQQSAGFISHPTRNATIKQPMTKFGRWSDLLNSSANPYHHIIWSKTEASPVHFAFDIAVPPTQVVAMLVPPKNRAEGYNVYSYFTNFFFAPKHPDYFSYRLNSFHVQYFTHRHHQSHPLANVKRYVDSKSKQVHANFIAMMTPSDDPADATDKHGNSKFSGEVCRPEDTNTTADAANDSDQSDADDGTNADKGPPPYTSVAIDGPKAGNWAGALMLQAFHADLHQQILHFQTKK